MDDTAFRLLLYLPAQGAAETEATLVQWSVGEGDQFQKGQVLAQAESAKSVFDFEAPCAGRVLRRLRAEGEVTALDQPVLEIETCDVQMKNWIPPAAAVPEPLPQVSVAPAAPSPAETAVILGFGGYLPDRVVTNEELVRNLPDVSPDYVYQVTGIRQRRWAADDQKPSDMAYAAALDAIRNSGVAIKDIHALIVATTTPDVAMPSTACILHDRLALRNVPAFDLNAACSGWLYAVSVARGMILTGMARNVLTVGVEMQSRLLDPSDKSAYFIFGDGAGAAILSAGTTGHRVREVVLGSDTRGLHMARRHEPGYLAPAALNGCDPWIRLDGQPLFRVATESFASIIHHAIAHSGWTPDQTTWIIPHQANGRIVKAAAKRCRIPPQRFYVNIERLGNTSSASIPLALLEIEKELKPNDRLILCSVGAGMTMAAASVEW
jgi:3-oxoacyl-[acyl-carrier-protein] synthase-3